MSDVVAAARPAKKTTTNIAESAAKETMPEKPLREEQAYVLQSRRFEGAEYARAEFDAILPADRDFKDALKPGCWANIVHLLKKNPTTTDPDRTGAHINLATEDHAFEAKLYVTAVLPGGLLVTCTGPQIDPKTGKACAVDLETGLPWSGREPIESDVFKAQWNNGKQGYDIVRKQDMQTVADGASLKTAALAKEWIAKTVKDG